MKLKCRNLVPSLLLVALGAGSYALWQHLVPPAVPATARKVLFYQDSMHPWIKSDQPGKCTICAMDLTPIHEGEQAFGREDEPVVTLSSSSVTVLNVQADEVRRRPIRRTLRVAGVLEADSTRKTVIAAPAPGRIDDVLVASAGVEVLAGEVLASFYSPDLTFQTRRYIFRDRIGEKTNTAMSMPAAPGASSRHAPNPLPSRRDQPLAARERAEPDPYYNDLLATITGTVVERNVFDGQYVAEGDRLFTIVDCSTLWFRFDAYEHQLPWLEPGQPIEIAVPSLPGRVFPAVIAVIEPILDERTRTAKVRADVPNPLVGSPGRQRRLLHLGMYADGRLQPETAAVLSVPRSAILFPGGDAYAYLDQGGGAYEMRRVTLGLQGDDRWQILNGLDEGDRVVTSGNVLIDAQAQFSRVPASGGADAAPIASSDHGCCDAEPSITAPSPTTEPSPVLEAHLPHVTVAPIAAAMGTPAKPAVAPSTGRRGIAGYDRAAGAFAARLAMNPHGASNAPAGHATNSPAKTPEPTAQQRETVEAFVATVDGISRGLAADNLEQYWQHMARLPDVLAKLEAEYPAPRTVNALIRKLRALPSGATAKTLEDARKSFLPFSSNAVELVKLLRKGIDSLDGMKIYHCPMAPAPGLWLQAKGPLRNPYYGAKMLTCGEEVTQ